MLAQRRPTVCDVGPTLKQHCCNVFTYRELDFLVAVAVASRIRWYMPGQRRPGR